MRRQSKEDWLIERLLVSSDLTEGFIYLYSWSDAILNSKAQITHFRWGGKLGLDWKFPDGAEVRKTIGLIPRFSPTPEAACVCAASLHLLWIETAGTQNNERVLLIWPSPWECSTDLRLKKKKREQKIKRKDMLTWGQGKNRSAEWIYLAHILCIRAFSHFES